MCQNLSVSSPAPLLKHERNRSHEILTLRSALKTKTYSLFAVGVCVCMNVWYACALNYIYFSIKSNRNEVTQMLLVVLLVLNKCVRSNRKYNKEIC